MSSEFIATEHTEATERRQLKGLTTNSQRARRIEPERGKGVSGDQEIGVSGYQVWRAGAVDICEGIGCF
jgi:hypothetical protein